MDYDWVFSNTGRVHVLEAFEREFAGGDIEIASGIGLDSFEGLSAFSCVTADTGGCIPQQLMEYFFRGMQ